MKMQHIHPAVTRCDGLVGNYCGQNMKREQRLHPRFSLSLEAELIAQNDAREEVTTQNLSMKSVQVEASAAFVDRLLASDEFPVLCTLRLALPAGRPEEQGEEISALCQLVTYRRLSQACYSLALGFAEFHGDSRQRLEQALDAQTPQGYDRLVVPSLILPQRRQA